MTRVRKAAAVSLMTPMVAAAIAVGLGQPAEAAGCLLGSATITPPSGTVTVGSTVQVSANVSGVTLLNGEAHLQISGPGLDQQVGKSTTSGEIKGDVTVPKPGYFTLAVIGNSTNCTYRSDGNHGFSVKDKPGAAQPSHSSAPSKNPQSGSGGSRGSSAGGVPSLPTGSGANGTGANNYALNPLNGASPFSLPSVAPDGTQFQYPSPDPQVASPPSQPMARNVSQTTPIKWGQSLAIALVLLIISAHLGMWSRRQRLAAAGASSGAGKPGGRPGRRRRSRKTALTTAQASALADSPVLTAQPTDTAVQPTGTAVQPTGATFQSAGETGQSAGAPDPSTGTTGRLAGAADRPTGMRGTDVSGSGRFPAFGDMTATDGTGIADSAGARTTENNASADTAARESAASDAPTEDLSAVESQQRTGGRSYRGRRRRH